MGDTAETAQVQPTNQIVLDSKGIHIQTKRIETATSVYPGTLVLMGTNDDEIVTCGAAGEAIGWLGYEQTAKTYRGATIDTIAVIDTYHAVINGPGIILIGRLASGQTVDKGSRLMAAAAGELSGATVGTDEVVAIAEESKASTAPLTKILVRSLI